MENEPIEIEIEPSDSMCNYPLMLFPSSLNDDHRNCQCRLIENDIYSFHECVQNCQPEYQLTLSKNSTGIYASFMNITSDFLFLFHCDEGCVHDSPCRMESEVLLYRINVGKLLVVLCNSMHQLCT